MLENKNAMATIAVKDLTRARKFYEGVLGFTPVGGQDGETVNYRSGGSTVLVYKSDFAGTNKATSATWDVGGDLETIVRDLKAKGVAFEHYDMPGTALRGDIHVSDGVQVAWFKDPDGNIISMYKA
jgi:catechol 2,3-dioxygenase-like lactoylglutathione lyase family enzyme